MADEPSRAKPSVTTQVFRGHRLFAALYGVMMLMDRSAFTRTARRYVAGLAYGDVLEVGAGTGANLAYYTDISSLTLVEPDPYMLRRLHRRLRALRRHAAIYQSALEQLPFPDQRFDCAVVTLVLCSVADPQAGLAELRRVLKPGGKLRFFEHVRVPGWGGRFQEAITPLWRQIAGGCHLSRDTTVTLQAAGFTIREMQTHSVPLPIGRFITGVAERPS